MVTYVVHCAHCDSTNLIRFGYNRNGKQRFHCHDCDRCSTQNPGSAAHDPAFKAKVLAACQERSSMRGVCRTFGISRNTLAKWLKKSERAATTLEHTGPGSAGGRARTR